MADKNKNTAPKEQEEWIQCKSKSRPGLKYMFNTLTGASQWLKKDDGTGKPEAATAAPNNKTMLIKPKTPAQDRLKRLQRDIVKVAPKLQDKQLKNVRLMNLRIPANNANNAKTAKRKFVDDENAPSQVNVKKPIVKSRKRANSSPERPKKQTKLWAQLAEEVKIIKPVSQFKIPKKKTISTIAENPKIFPNKLVNEKKMPSAITNHTKNADVNSTIEPVQTAKATTTTTTTTLQVAQNIGLANKRLEDLRRSLHQERHKFIDNVEVPNKDDGEKVEPMDWESESVQIDEIPKSDVTNNITRSTSTYYNKQTINDNLINYANERQRSPKDNCDKWQKDFYYFIADTNVFLDHLSFLDELITMQLHDTCGSMLYIPYIVIKELDGLKMRESVALRAKRAINYIHHNLKNKSPHVQTQSAIDEKDHIIDIDSPDDAIINCCLQVQRHVDNVLLLSEDTNLRNKAQCNNLLVSTKSDLTSFHANSKSPTDN